jgi:hypothetical protein
MDEVKKGGDGASDRECTKTALCSGYYPGKECREIKIGGNTSSLPLLITLNGIGGPGGNVPMAPQCYVMLAFRVLSLYVFPEIIINGCSRMPFFTVDGRWRNVLLNKKFVKWWCFGFLQLVGQVFFCKNPKAYYFTSHGLDPLGSYFKSSDICMAYSYIKPWTLAYIFILRQFWSEGTL